MVSFVDERRELWRTKPIHQRYFHNAIGWVEEIVPYHKPHAHVHTMARPQRIYHVHRGGRKLQVPRNENDDDEEQEMPESEEGESDSKDGNYDEEGNSSETPDEEDDVDDNDYDDEEDSLDGMANNGRKRRSNRSVAQRPVRARRSVGSTSYREVDEDEEFELENNEPPPKDKPAPRNKSRKGSNKRSRRNAKFTSKLQQDDDETYSSEEDVKPKATPRRRTFADIENDDEESFKVEDESEEENYESEESEGVERRHAGKRKRGRPKKQPDSSNEEEEYASEEEEEERPIRTPQRKRGRPKKTVSRRKKSVVDEDSDDDKEDVGWTPTSRKSTRGSTSRSSRRSSRIASNRPSASRELDEDDGDSNHSNADELEDDDLIFPASIARRTTPPRTSATIASRNISSAAKSKHGESSDEEEEPTESPSPRRRKAHLSSDEEFLEDDSEVDGVHETDSDDIVDDGDFEDDDSSLEQPKSASRPSYNVDTEQVGTMDDSSSSEDENARHSTPSWKRRDSGAFSRSELAPRPHRPKGMDDSSSSDSSDSETEAARASENAGSLSRPRLPDCSSVEDAITGETLPKRHVCYFSPDGSSKQCFALETLRQIALTSSQRNFRTDLIGDNQQVAFLQPPHFRTVMSAFYLDQIASRFGREALNIHGEYYNRRPSEPRREGGTLESSSSDEDAFNEVGSYHYSQSFHDDLQRYIDRQMGSQDVYACPLCYSEMHTRVDNPSREDESEDGDDGDIEDSSQFVESKYDPMLVLGYLDNDQFQAASSFCFTKVANIKKHLRDDHHVDTKGIQGNDLYARFKVRAPDGLLQRYLKKSFQYGTSRQGDMRRYWNAGNNYNFVHLLYMIQKANRHRNRLNGRQDEDNNNMATNHDNEETPEDYFEVAQDFFASFQNRARRLWGRLSSPFQTSKVDDLKDFLAADDDYEEEEDAQEALAHRQVDSLRQDPQEDSNDFISKIQRKYAETSSVEYDDGEEDDEEDGDSELEIVGKPPATLGEDNEDTEMNGYYSVEEEVSDPWEVSIKQKIKRKKLSKVSPSATPKIRKKISRKSRNGSLSASAQKRGTHTLEDSDSDF